MLKCWKKRHIFQIPHQAANLVELKIKSNVISANKGQIDTTASKSKKDLNLHENEVITSRLFFSHFSNVKRNTNFRGIFFFHFLNGALPFPYISIFLLHPVSVLSLSLFGVVYGIVLWASTSCAYT